MGDSNDFMKSIGNYVLSFIPKGIHKPSRSVVLLDDGNSNRGMQLIQRIGSSIKAMRSTYAEPDEKDHILRSTEPEKLQSHPHITDWLLWYFHFMYRMEKTDDEIQVILYLPALELFDTRTPRMYERIRQVLVHLGTFENCSYIKKKLRLHETFRNNTICTCFEIIFKTDVDTDMREELMLELMERFFVAYFLSLNEKLDDVCVIKNFEDVKRAIISNNTYLKTNRLAVPGATMDTD